jgi:hypothetical protein
MLQGRVGIFDDPQRYYSTPFGYTRQDKKGLTSVKNVLYAGLNNSGTP